MRPVRWSVVGVGTAGRARARAIQADPRCRLVGVWRGRHAAAVGAPVLSSLNEAIEVADAVAICSPSEHHRAQAEAVLRQRRHALVEFPLAAHPAQAQALHEVAHEHQVILHVEHIELLDAPCRALCGAVRPELVERVLVQFDGPGPAEAGAPALSQRNIARLHRLCAVAGPVSEVLESDARGGELTASLRHPSGATSTLLFRQAPYLRRRTVIEVTTPADTWRQENHTLERSGVPTELTSTPSLFASDQAVMTARILDNSASYVSDERILHVLEIAHRLSKGQVGPLV